LDLRADCPILDSMLDERNPSKGLIWKLADLLGMTAHLERRDRRRLKADFRAVLTGDCGFIEVRGIDASRYGIGVLAPEPVLPGALVFVRLKELGLAGFAHVRRSVPLPDGRFMLGLQFRGELARERSGTGTSNLERLAHTCGVWDAASEYAKY
jgi:hypothetical protein